jgi:PilZ domain
MTHHDLSPVGDHHESRPALPPAGAILTVTPAGEHTATVIVERSIDGHITGTLQGGTALQAGGATVRWFEPGEPTLEVAAVIAAADHATRVHLRLMGPWQEADGRRAQRFEARYPMPGHVLQMVENSLVPNLRLDLVCIDLSANGMLAAYHGRPPQVGERIELQLGTASVRPMPVVARVTRVASFPFGRSEVGLSFVFDSSAERQHVMAVRDDLAGGPALGAVTVAV